jgi:hypothetical protein
MDENTGIVGFLFRLERLSGEDDFAANVYRITDSWYNRKIQQRGSNSTVKRLIIS